MNAGFPCDKATVLKGMIKGKPPALNSLQFYRIYDFMGIYLSNRKNNYQ
jgi:hypothetical protein